MKGFFKSVNAALEGVIHTLYRERNMRLHFIVGFLVLIAGVYLNLDHGEIILLLFAVTFVLAAEMFNTAIENLADLTVKEEFHPVIKIVKDVSAGAVFVAAVNAGVTGYLLVANRVDLRAGGLLFRIKHSSWHITLITMLVCVGLVLLIKVMRREKSLLRGGMPSGHSAVAFAIWTSVSLLTLDLLVSGMVFLLAVLVARSRMMTGVHSICEVIAGCVLGTLAALLVFQVLS